MGLVILLSLSGSSWLCAQVTSELRAGKWIEVAAPATQVSTTQPTETMDPELNRIEELIREGNSKQANKAAIQWLKFNKGSQYYDRALFLEAEALFLYGDRIKSFYYLDELLDEYAESPLYFQALDRQYDIADAYLNGYQRRFLGIPMLSAEEEAIEMLFRIQQRAPKSPVAEKSLLRTADYYYSDAQYDLAEDAYRVYAESYPHSPEVPRVLLRQAYSNLAQFRGLKFDATPVIDAKIQLQDVIEKYPDLAAQENIPSVIERIDHTFARKLYVTADFYRRTHEPRAAAYTLQQLVKLYPNTPEASDARNELARYGTAMVVVPSTQPTP